MPITASAKKALRQDRRRAIINKRIKRKIKETLKKARQKPTKKTLAEAASALDRAAKKKIIHKNKAARLKSRLAKLLKIKK
jgi:small subunit ribosomal protein S20